MSGCVFCDIVAGSNETKVVYDWDEFVGFYPLNPVTPGHLLVVPKRHVADFTEDPLLSGQTVAAAALIQQYRESNEGAGDCNLITSKGAVATQTVMHLHVHLVPRTAGDGLTLPWTRACECGHNRTAHLDHRSEPTACAYCGCLAYAGPKRVVAFDAGCAECHPGPDEPLIEATAFESVEAAKAHYADKGWLQTGPEPRTVRWRAHPQGGEHVVVGQGSVWLRPE